MKRLIAIALMGLFAFAIGCGGASEPAPATPGAKKEQLWRRLPQKKPLLRKRPLRQRKAWKAKARPKPKRLPSEQYC